MLGRPATGVSSSCNLLRRCLRERADPGLVARSDVVNRIKTEEGRKPAARSSSSGGRSSCNVPEAPGGLSAEPWSWPPFSPPRRLLSGRVSVSHLPPPLAGPPSLHPRFSRRFLGLSRTAVAAVERGCFSGSVVPRPNWLVTLHREKPAATEPASPSEEEACDLAFSAGNQSSGLAGKWTVSPGGFIFRVRQSTWVEAYNGVKRES